MSERTDVPPKRIDLSLPQVAGSAVAAVVAAKLASYFGVYGTILGAGVVSIVATCGGSLFQHFFSRTGEQLRDVTVAARTPEQGAPVHGEFTPGTVYRARVVSWKRPLLAAAVVFGVTMGGITAYELASGSSLSGDGGTTVSKALPGGASSSAPADGSNDSEDQGDSGRGETADRDAGTGGEPSPSGSSAPAATDEASPTPGTGDEGGTASTAPPTETAGSPSPSATPDGSAPATTPAPSASSRSGTGGRGQDGPATP
ncbi:hypothetical protein [Streptomyces sp. NPDC058867]|uniref:hypothetical protein n=1 Tax=unclassified Streptomyces TaxID=2593676 RepID=UPI00367E2A41